MHLNVMNGGLIENLPGDCCVEVCCTADASGIHPHAVGRLPVQLAALCLALADLQTLASDAFLSCTLDPLTAACAAPRRIRECFNDLLEGHWGKAIRV